MPNELKFKTTNDASQFHAAMASVEKRATEAAGRIGGAFKNFGASFLTPLTALGPTIAAAFSGQAIISGVKDIFDAGRGLMQLSRSTGIAVPGLVILESKFKLAGLQADGVGMAIARMQKTLSGSEDTENAGGSKQLHTLFKDVAALQKLSPDKQFLAIGRAIAVLPDPAQRTAVAMQIFGREGRELVGVFTSPGFADISTQLQRKADMMGRNAAQFEQASIKLEHASNIFKSFYAGTAAGVVNGLNPVLDRLEKINLGQQGQQFGEGMARGLWAADAVAKILGGLADEASNLPAKAKNAGGAALDAIMPGWQIPFTALTGLGMLGDANASMTGIANQIANSAAKHAAGFSAEHSAPMRVQAGNSMFKHALPTDSEHFKRPFVVGGRELDWGQNVYDETAISSLELGRTEIGLHGGKDNPFNGAVPWANTQDGVGVGASYGGNGTGAVYAGTARPAGQTGNIWSQISGRTGGDIYSRMSGKAGENKGGEHGAAIAQNTKELLNAFIKAWTVGGGGGGGGGGVTATK